MHEASLIRALVQQVEALVARHSAAKATEIKLLAGEFSGVEPELLELAFENQAKSPAVQGARLVVRRAVLAGECPECSASFHIQRFEFRCPACHNTAVRVTGGEELLLESVTMEGEP